MIRASNDEYEALVEASCPPEAGMVLRAPTIAQGLAPFCKDTFYGRWVESVDMGVGQGGFMLDLGGIKDGMFQMTGHQSLFGVY